MANAKAAGRLAIGGVTVFTVAVVVLHVLQPHLDPREVAVSYYVHGSFGWLLTVGLLALGIGSLGLVHGLRGVGGRRASAGRWLIGVWGVGVLLGGAFRADPPGHWDEPPSTAGMIHGNAAMVAFLALPIGALLLSIGIREAAHRRRGARLLGALAVASAISLILFFASLAPVFVRPGPPILLGLSERVLLAIYASWLAAAGVRLIGQDAPVPQGSESGA